MRNLAAKTPEQVQDLQRSAAAHFAPMLLREALQRLSRLQGKDQLDTFESEMVDLVESIGSDDADFVLMKEFAIEQLYQAVREARHRPHAKQSLEDIRGRRTAGRSEEAETLEEQLDKGLEDSFPASDPPAVVSSTISGTGKSEKK